MGEIRAYDLRCQCEVVAPSAEVAERNPVQHLNLTASEQREHWANLHYLRLSEKNEITMVFRPKDEQVTEISLAFPNTPRIRGALRWEISAEKYREILDLHVHGNNGEGAYGRSRTFDEALTIQVMGPHWLRFEGKTVPALLELRHEDRFDHLHPEYRTLDESALPMDCKRSLIAAGFNREKKHHLYYFSAQGYNETQKDDSGWVIFDLEQRQAATWSATRGTLEVKPLGAFPTVFLLPSPNRRRPKEKIDIPTSEP